MVHGKLCRPIYVKEEKSNVDVANIIRTEISVNRVLARGGGECNSYRPTFSSASLFIFNDNIYVTLPPRFFNSWVHVSKHNTVSEEACRDSD
jgi:hypothetical protein